MKRMSWKKHIFRPMAALLGLVLALSAFSATAFADNKDRAGGTTCLTAVFAPEKTGPIEGVPFRLYLAATLSEKGEYLLTEDFSGAAVSMEDMGIASKWADMAVTLSAYAGANGIAPGAAAATDAEGKVFFSSLSEGMYLLEGDAVVVGGEAYTPAPVLILLHKQMDDDAWNHGSIMEVKTVKTDLPDKPDPERPENPDTDDSDDSDDDDDEDWERPTAPATPDTSGSDGGESGITVKKVWEDGGRSGRPDSVEIQLLQDGNVYDTVILSAANGWTHTWSGLSFVYGDGEDTKLHSYLVNETSVPADYTVLVSWSGNEFTVTNTYEGVPEETSGNSLLPQTGALNWPVPVLTIAGLMLASAGWCLFNRKKEN